MNTIEQIKAPLVEWEKHCKAVDEQYDALYALTGISIESPLSSAIYRAMAAYTNAVAALVEDEGGWLNYYQYECYFGRRPMEVLGRNGKELLLNSVDVLALLVSEK